MGGPAYISWWHPRYNGYSSRGGAFPPPHEFSIHAPVQSLGKTAENSSTDGAVIAPHV